MDIVREAVPQRSVARFLSHSEAGLDILRQAGILQPIEGPAKGLLGKLDYYRNSDLEALLGRARELAQPVECIEDLLTVEAALQSLDRQPIPSAVALVQTEVGFVP